MSDPAFPQGEGEQLKWVELDSNSVSSVAFVEDKGLLYVKFSSGSKWVYENVHKQQYRSLINAGSSGGYLRKEIVAHHAGHKIDSDGDTGPEGRNSPGTLSQSPFST